MQRDAVDRLGLTRMLLEPELLSAVEPDIHLVGTLLSLSGVMPQETKETAREVVRKVVAELEGRLAEQTRAAISGALDRAARTHRPRLPTSTGRAPSGRTSSTIRPSSARSSRSG